MHIDTSVDQSDTTHCKGRLNSLNMPSGEFVNVEIGLVATREYLSFICLCVSGTGSGFVSVPAESNPDGTSTSCRVRPCTCANSAK